jgi:hypothetical protein
LIDCSISFLKLCAPDFRFWSLIPRPVHLFKGETIMSWILRSGVIAAASALTFAVTAPAALAATIFVAPSPPGVPMFGTSCTLPDYNSIQTAVSAALVGDTVIVCDGVYEEQVEIVRSLSLRGSGNSVIDAPATLVGFQDLVTIRGAATVTMSGFTITGPGPGGCASIQAGVRVREGATLDLSFTRIEDIRDEPFGGCQNGEGIRVGARGGVGGPGHATIDNVIVEDYQKNGITISGAGDGAGTTARVTNSTVTGIGPTTVIAQNGVQVSGGAAATISNSVIRNHDYTPNTFFACGLLFFDAGGVDDTDNIYWANEKDKCGALGRGGTYNPNS